MPIDRSKVEQKVKKAVLGILGKKIDVKDSDSFVGALGFNSLRMVSLSLALEEEFGRPLLLNDWISQCADPHALTVGSLADYIRDLLIQDE